MVLENFKGVQKATYEFSDQTSITGDNATGKSTIYEAYLWCLFDKNQQGNATNVQPLDENNEVKHKLETFVVLFFDIDGVEFIAERHLQEKWVKPRGTTELVCQGTTSDYAINAVPMTKTQYGSKLEEIMPLEKWFLLSSINIIPNLDQKACRAALQAIAPAIDDKVIASNYPAVLKALQDGLKIEELSATIKHEKAKSKEELDSIPAALAAQDRLRVVEDFDALEKELAEVDIQVKARRQAIDDCQKQQADQADVDKANELYDNLSVTNAKIAAIENDVISRTRKANQDIELRHSECVNKVNAINQRMAVNTGTTNAMLKDIENYNAQIDSYRNQWMEKNDEVYTEPDIMTICPTCGQAIPEERVNEARAKALEEWNTRKRDELARIQKDAESIKARIEDIKKRNEANQEETKAMQQQLNDLHAEIERCDKEHESMPKADAVLAVHEEYLKLIAEKAAIEEEIAKASEARDHDEEKQKAESLKHELTQIYLPKRDELMYRLAGRDTNDRIDVERTRLEGRQIELAEIIANLEGKEAQIAAFRKAKITAVENGVSSLFTMVHWKMYEANVTNDGEKEICQAIIDGVPYEQQNRATQVNAGIDIVNAFAKAYGVSAPLFIDNAESVSNVLNANGQRITLSVVKGAPLQVE